MLHESVRERPWASDRARMLVYEAAALYDGQLRRLAHISGAIDRSIAVGLGRLQRARGYVRLGFARFDDYARERVGVPARTAYDLARLGVHLERLPKLDRALAEGRVTWSAAALVARVANEATESSWVDAACNRSVRELAAIVRRVTAGETVDPDEPDPPGGAGDSREAETASSDGLADEPSRSFAVHVKVPAPTALLWDAAAELCELVAGRRLDPTETTEFLLADFLSAHACGGPACPMTGPEDDRDRVGERGGTRHADTPGIRRAARRRGRNASPLGSRPAAACDCRPGSLREPSLSLSRESRRILEVLDRRMPEDPFEIDATLRCLTGGRAAAEVDLARLLRTFRSLGLHRALGHSGFTEYVCERLSISAARARFLIRLDRSMSMSELLCEAARSGAIGLVAAETLGRVIRERPGDDALVRSWVERARERTVVRLCEEVDWVCREAKRWTDLDLSPPPPGALPSALEELTAAMARRVGGVARAAGVWAPDGRTAMRDADAARDARSTDVTDHGRTAADRQTSADESAGEVTLSFRVTDEVYGMLLHAGRLCAPDGPGWVDADVIRAVALEFLESHLPLWWEHVAAAERIAVRDRFRCQVPGCSSRCGSAHHIRYRSRGGSDDDWNLVFICPTHHLEGIHRGHLRVGGRAPADLTFELGVRSDGTVLQRFRGQRRVA